MAIKIRNVEALKGHRLALAFSDGTKGTADLASHVKRKPFLALADDAVFRTARVEHGAVEWPGADVGIATEALYALAHDLPKPKTIHEARANELVVSLRELRVIAERTQADVAEKLDVSQAAISQLESAPDHKLSALRRYVESLGATLEVAAVLGGKRITLRGV